MHGDRETKEWFYPTFSAQLHENEARAKDFCEFLDAQRRIEELERRGE